MYNELHYNEVRNQRNRWSTCISFTWQIQDCSSSILTFPHLSLPPTGLSMVDPWHLLPYQVCALFLICTVKLEKCQLDPSFRRCLSAKRKICRLGLLYLKMTINSRQGNPMSVSNPSGFFYQIVIKRLLVIYVTNNWIPTEGRGISYPAIHGVPMATLLA